MIGLLEERQREAARRVEVLREEADRILAQLRDAERDWERFVISRETVVEVLAGPDHDDVTAGTDGPATENPLPTPVPRSVVPAWCERVRLRCCRRTIGGCWRSLLPEVAR